MAGAFGFENDKYEISLEIGELELLPAVRDASPETLIIANGFSCREQISQETGRHALHLAEVIQMGLRQMGEAIREQYPEQVSVQRREKDIQDSMRRSAWALAALAASSALLWGLSNRRNRD